MSLPWRIVIGVVSLSVGVALCSGVALAEGVPPLDSNAWPRVFYEGKQRLEIVRKRLPPDLREAAQPATIDPATLPPPTFTLEGIARGEQGASAIINGRWYRPGDRIFNWIVKIESNQVILNGVDVPILKMKPGQSVRIDNGATSESVPHRAFKFGSSTATAPRATQP